MSRFEFYKSLYETEINKITELNDSLNIPLAIIGIIGASHFTLIMNFIYNGLFSDTYFFCAFSILSIISLIISVYYLIRVFAFSFRDKYKYRYVEDTDELEEIYRNIVNDNPMEEFENFLIRRYIVCCGTNARINKNKNKSLNIGKEYLAASLILIIGSIITFLINFIYHNESFKI